MSADALAALQAYVERTGGPPSRAHVRQVLAERETMSAEARRLTEETARVDRFYRKGLTQAIEEKRTLQRHLASATRDANDARSRTTWLAFTTVLGVIPLSAFAGYLIHWPWLLHLHA